MAVFRNVYFLLFLGLYGISAAYMLAKGVTAPADLIFGAVAFGLVFPGLAYLMCRKAKPLPQAINITKAEILAVLGCVVLLSLYLVWGKGFLSAGVSKIFGTFPGLSPALSIAEKVLVFVGVPLLVFSKGFGYKLKDLGFTTDFKAAFSRRNLLLLAVFAGLFLTLQAFAGKAARPLFSGDYSVYALVTGALITFPLLVIHVGLTEEFFFRVLVQSRMTAWLKSEVAGIAVMALLFGLYHAPDIYLRGAGVWRPLGVDPGLLTTVAYTITVLALSSLVFGVIWAKTRNFYILILIHAMVDLLPGIPRVLDGLGIK